VEWDPAESVPLNTTLYPEQMAALEQAYASHLASLIPGVSQYEQQDWSLIICCHSGFNLTLFEEYLKAGDWSLAEWEALGCVCEPPTPSSSSSSLFSSPASSPASSVDPSYYFMAHNQQQRQLQQQQGHHLSASRRAEL
jgi:hypothetical protein